MAKSANIIEKLTGEQESKLVTYRDKWLGIGLATGDCNFEEAKKHVNMAYKIADLEPPSQFFLVDSPWACALKLMELGIGKDSPIECLNAQAFGCHDANWLGFYEFFKIECGIKEANKLDGLMGLASDCGWWAPLSDICILQHKPSKIHITQAGLLHNDSGPSILYRDGWKVWSIQGVRVNEKIVMHPETLTLDEINGEKNAEIRRIMIERFGTSRYLEESKAEILDADYEGAKRGSAPRCLIKDKNNQKWMYATDGSTSRGYYIPVQEDAENCSQAHSAIAGFDEKRIVSKS